MQKKANKPDNREYTIKIIPHKGESIKSIRLPIRIIKYGAAAICVAVFLMVGTFAYSTYHVNAAKKEQFELNELRQANQIQQTQILQLSKKANELQENMDKLNSLENEIRQIAAMESNDTSRSGFSRSGEHNGQGGPRITPDIKIINDTLDALSQSIEPRRQSLEELKQSLVSQKAQMAITPSIWPSAGEVSSRYGLRWEGSDFHPGIDIAADEGTPVVATADGVVAESGWNSGGYGYLIDIDHGNGIVTRYAHNSQLVVNAGERVKKGQVVAYMGNTGLSTGSHVHYEVIVHGKAVNPNRFL